MQAIWMDTSLNKDLNFPRLRGDIQTDVLVVGGGIAGILCADKLKRSGCQCVVVEGGSISSGATSCTTAKITAQHGLIYSQLIKKYGLAAARQYYNSNSAAVEEYRALAAEYPCDFEDKTAYVYCRGSADAIYQEATAYDRLGIERCRLVDSPLPFRITGAIGMKNQAQFNPRKLLNALAEGLEIYENTAVLGIEDNRALTAQGVITAKKIILATHYPLINVPGLYFMKLYQHRSYVIALENGRQVDGMFVDCDQHGLSFRNYGSYLLLGGGSHRTGRRGGGYAEIMRFAAKEYPSCPQKYAWATQDCMSLDGMPYIGIHRTGTPNLFVATGFNKWGMTGSMVAASVLTDLITMGSSPYMPLFSPQRGILCGQLISNIASAVRGLLSFGKRCTHMGCALRWNEAEHSWDCACHGSRFDEQGRVLNNPAKREKHLHNE